MTDQNANPPAWAQPGPTAEPTPKPANGRRGRRPKPDGEKKRQRRPAAPRPEVVPAPPTSFQGELEFVLHIVSVLRGMPKDTRARIVDAIIKLT